MPRLPQIRTSKFLKLSDLQSMGQLPARCFPITHPSWISISTFQPKTYQAAKYGDLPRVTLPPWIAQPTAGVGFFPGNCKTFCLISFLAHSLTTCFNPGSQKALDLKKLNMNNFRRINFSGVLVCLSNICDCFKSNQLMETEFGVHH